MRKSTVWLIVTIAAIAALSLFGCSQQSPVGSGSGSPETLSSPQSEIVPGEYIVVLKSSGSNGLSKRSGDEARQIALAAGVSPSNVYNTVLSGFAGKLSDVQYQTLLNDPAVDYIEPNYTAHMIAQTVPWGISHINSQVAHGRGVTGSGVKVGVIDTGIDYSHPDLAGNYAGGIDYVNGDNDPMDDEGHGTHVSGTIAAIDNSIGVLGVAPAAQLYGIKVLDNTGSGTYADVISGIDWAAANGMNVANMSLGGSVGTNALKTSCDNAYAGGLVICAATGNGYGAPVGYPAAYSSVIAVSSITQSNTLSSFSNVGPEVEVTAPGSSIYSTYPGGYATMSGTSMATPHATGVCALIWATGNYNSASAVRNRLTGTCIDLGPGGRDNDFGYGLVDADAATAGTAPPTNQAPTANANGPYSAQTGSAINFSSAGSSDPDGTITGYSWDFGDGGTSTAANPTYTYNTAGTYNVTLTVTDDQGATGSNATTATITNAPPQNQAPTANANGPYTGTAGSAVSFSSAGSSDPDGTITGYSWSFGDGGTSTAANPSYTYGAAGTYTVALTVTDDQGATGSNSTTATISAGGGGGGDVVTITRADFRADKGDELKVRAESTDPTATLTLVGYGVMTYKPDKNRWEYKQKGITPCPGTVTVTSDLGGSASSSVNGCTGGGNQAPTANANGPYSAQTGSAINFSSAGSNDPDGTIASYAWDFGDGGTSNAANPNYTYASAGTYNVTLTVTDDQGATGSNSTTATISSGGGGGDVVTITKAEYDPAPDKLKLSVRAESTDPTATLTVVGYGVMTYKPDKNRWELKMSPVDPGPTSVTVTSDKGGSDTSAVTWK